MTVLIIVAAGIALGALRLLQLWSRPKLRGVPRGWVYAAKQRRNGEGHNGPRT